MAVIVATILLYLCHYAIEIFRLNSCMFGVQPDYQPA